MDSFENGNLKIKISESRGTSVMSWMGQSEARDPAAILNPYLNQFLEKFQGKELTLEYRSLEYMNSSTVAPIIHFINKLNKKGIKTEVLYNANLKWQEVSFKALKTLSQTMPNITVKGM